MTMLEPCPACGAPGVGDGDGCQAVYAELAARAYTDLRYAAVQDLAFDTYCMQHLETYCRSAKSYAAHLTRLCIGLEYAGDPAAYAAIQKWLNGRSNLVKPEILPFLGTMTIADVYEASTPQDYTRLVYAWAEHVWGAYASQHTLARGWIRSALNQAAKEE